MVPNGEGWHYLAVKKLSALLRRITSKHHSDFNYLYFYIVFFHLQQKTNVNLIKNYVKIKIVML